MWWNHGCRYCFRWLWVVVNSSLSAVACGGIWEWVYCGVVVGEVVAIIQMGVSRNDDTYSAPTELVMMVVTVFIAC